MTATFTGNYVALMPWARKDHCRPFGARNLYYVARETEKAILVAPVDVPYGSKMEHHSFWAAKSAVADNLGNGSMHFDDQDGDRDA